MKYSVLLIVLYVLLMGGCNNYEVSKPLDENREILLLNISAIEVNGDDFFRTGDEMGVFILPENASLETEPINYNTKMVYEEGQQWKSLDKLYWLSNDLGSKMDLISYYPYNENAGKELLPIEVRSDQSIQNENSDEFLWGKVTLVKEGVNIPQNVVMNHLTSALIFHVRFVGENAENNTGIEGLRIMSYADGKLDCLTGDVSLYDNIRKLIPYCYPNAEYGDVETYSCYISPQNYDDDLFLTFEWKNEILSKNFTYNFESGKVYQFTLEISDEPKLTLDSQMPIEQWDNDFQYGQVGAKYKVCDPWPDAENVQGYVIRVREGDNPGLIMGIPTENELRFIKEEKFDYIFETYIEDLRKIDWYGNMGIYNMFAIKRLFHDLSDFPAFDYCDSLGGEWFIPTPTEMNDILYEFFWKDYNRQKQNRQWWIENISGISEPVSFHTSTLNLYDWKIYRLSFYFENENDYHSEYKQSSIYSASMVVLPFRYY